MKIYKKKIKKISQQSTVQPLYKTRSGETVTATKIVQKKIKAPKIWSSGSISGKSTSSIPWVTKDPSGSLKKKSDRLNRLGEISKISYRSSNPPKETPLTNIPPIVVPNDEKSFSGVIINDIGIVPNPDDDYLLYSDEEFADRDTSGSIEDIEGLIDKLIEVADHMDKAGEYGFADFSDFLVKKASATNSIDYSAKFNDIILKIIDSDIEFANDKVIDITKKFSNNIKLNMMNSEELDVAKKNSYDKAINNIDKYLKQ